MGKYLTTDIECNIVGIHIKDLKYESEANLQDCVIFEEEENEKYEKILSCIKKVMKIYWSDRKWEGAGVYYYITIPDKSDIKNIKVTESKVDTENGVYSYNFFKKKKDAYILLEILKAIFEI